LLASISASDVPQTLDFLSDMNIALAIFGILLIVFSLNDIFHHDYLQFDSLYQVRYPTLAVLLVGLGFFFYGLIGFIRGKRRRSGEEQWVASDIGLGVFFTR
jgi:hypothetical protein